MAKQMDDAEFWLPPKFLMDDDFVLEKEKLQRSNIGENNPKSLVSVHGFPTEFPYEFDYSSALGSPVESVVGSIETESSDEDEFLAGLTRRLPLSITHKLTVPSFSWDKNEKTGALASSPQSTLSGFVSWSASSNGSPNGPSQVPSPPKTPFGAQNDTWDLIYAAAGQVARRKMSNEASKFINFNHGRLLPKTHNHSFMNNSPSGLYPSQSLSYNLAPKNQTHRRQMKASNWKESLQQQQQLQQTQCRAKNNAVGGRSSGTCTRAMFLGGSQSVKRESAGTGVFLPRTYPNNTPAPQNKSGCSTVLVPAKVVQALNLNFADSSSHVQPHLKASFGPNYDALVARRNILLNQTRRNYRAEGGLNLPQEWSY
ncbi:hypothetical protein ES332_A05G392300v1 [Gossypium tomentosum]|uniref:Uncharacterized protein n=1 Tax=Gossypium tomentosum TaxID=34277 RepID=A0A5D2QPE3_GOSTO|nr:hypothetical protein ES332_A05G392300v1 [Gossypium tomentosum]